MRTDGTVLVRYTAVRLQFTVIIVRIHSQFLTIYVLAHQM